MARFEPIHRQPAGSIWNEQSVGGVSRFRAELKGAGYSRHAHDTFTVSLTEAGVQQFSYRGTVHRSLPGQVAVLHPDELHDGHPGSSAPFRYSCLHVAPSAIDDALRGARGTSRG